MDSKGKFSYTIIGEDSLIGEMSLLMNKPNQFSYFFDPYEKPVSVLFIPAEVFIEICDNNRGDAAFLKKIALNRHKQFNIFKNRRILSYMKTLLKKK
jgi:hypothetical protein